MYGEISYIQSILFNMKVSVMRVRGMRVMARSYPEA